MTNIKCFVDGVTVLGATSDVPYKGDAFYGMMCTDCASKKADSQIKFETPPSAIVGDPKAIDIQLLSDKNVLGSNSAVTVTVVVSGAPKTESQLEGGVVSTKGNLTSAEDPATEILADETLELSINGVGLSSIKLNANNVGTDIAADIQSKVRSLQISDVDLQRACAQFAVVFADKYILISGTPGETSEVIVTGGTAASKLKLDKDSNPEYVKGVAASKVVTFSDGVASVNLSAVRAGTTSLRLGAYTHPLNNKLDNSSKVDITFTE